MSLTSKTNVKYVYDLPYSERMALCRILDSNDKWETLAGQYMNFDMMTIQSLRRESRCGRSPTDELLTRWGHQNHTILELFVHLSKMQHYQAMLAIKRFVDAEYHRLIYEGESNFSRLYKPPTAPPEEVEPSRSVPSVNFNLSDSTNILPSKMDGIPRGPLDSEEKILNVNGIERDRAHSGGCDAQTAVVNNNNNKENNRKSPTFRGEPSRTRERSEISIGVESGGPPMIPFKELEIATDGWDPAAILGKGGFGTVYKGVWKNTAVAVKRTRATETDENQTVQIQQILGELRMLNAYRHDNVLPLYGFSVGGEDPCLIYQFMPNGSLEDRLLCRQGKPPLVWGQRVSIAVGTARGLQFLHTINEKPLIHGDIKSANILLDYNYQPKIGDFGLAREGPHNHYTHMKVSRVHGTRPYLPDEFLRGKKFSTKVDTHSFGIVLFELSTGLRAYDDQRTHKFLRDLIENSNDAQLDSLVDRKPPPEDPQTFRSLIDLGKVCASRKPKDRPEMVLVLQELETVAAHREIRQRAQQLVHRNSLTPATPVSPYELQLLHDQLSQQRNNNGSPVPDSRTLPRVVSPLPDSGASPRMVSPRPDTRAILQMISPVPDARTSPRMISPVPEGRGLPRVISPLPGSSPMSRVSPMPGTSPMSRVSPLPEFTPHDHIVRGHLPETMFRESPVPGKNQFSPWPAMIPSQVPSQPGQMPNYPVTNPFVEQNGNGGAVGVRNSSMYQIPVMVAQNSRPSAPLPLVLPKSPVISVSPPTAQTSVSAQSEEVSSESSVEEPAEQPPPEPEPPTEESQYSYIIPLISELGIKKEEAQSPEASPAEAAGPSSIKEPVTARGKSLCFINNSSG